MIIMKVNALAELRKVKIRMGYIPTKANVADLLTGKENGRELLGWEDIER